MTGNARFVACTSIFVDNAPLNCFVNHRLGGSQKGFSLFSAGSCKHFFHRAAQPGTNGLISQAGPICLAQPFFGRLECGQRVTSFTATYVTFKIRSLNIPTQRILHNNFLHFKRFCQSRLFSAKDCQTVADTTSRCESQDRQF